jgi:hypothetical protein
MSMPGGSGDMDWRINEVATDLVVTEAVGSLSPEELKRVIALVMERVRQERDRMAQHERDTRITDRAYRTDVE